MQRLLRWFVLWGMVLMGFAAACTAQNTPEPTATLPIPGPALIQFFTDP